MRKRSIRKKSVRTIVFSCFALGLTTLLIGLVIYTTSLVQQYVRHAFGIASHAAMNATYASMNAHHGVDSAPISHQVMTIYRGLSPQDRAKMGTVEYRRLFSSIDTIPKSGSSWDRLTHMLNTFVIEVDDVYIAMYDEATSALVYIADASADSRMYPGDWEAVSQNEVQKFLNWKGPEMLYDIDRTEKYGWLCTAGYPLRDGNGKVFAFLMVDVSVDNIIGDMLDFSLKVTIGILLLTFIIAWLGSRRIKKGIADPIDAIANAAMDYVQGRNEGTDRHYFSELNLKTNNELEDLSHVMADMEISLASHEEHIRTITAEKERINTELSMAQRIQAAMMPHVFPPFPDRKEFDLYALMHPAREVGGDFYDFFLIDPDHLALVIADVSGKGIPAALFMMISKIILQSCAMLGKSAGEILTKTNDALCSNNQVQMFVTVWLGILEISTGKMTCANAGHEYPALYSATQGNFTLFKDKHGLVIGGLPDIHYREYEIQLKKNDVLFVYTDGVPEATNEELNMFGTDRMLEVLNASSQQSTTEILESVDRSVKQFVGPAEQFDDLTMLCLRYNGI